MKLFYLSHIKCKDVADRQRASVQVLRRTLSSVMKVMLVQDVTGDVSARFQVVQLKEMQNEC